LILRDHLLLGMPFQTTPPLLPLTVPVSEAPKSLTLPAHEPLPDEQHKGHKDALALALAPSAASDAPALTPSVGKSNPPAASSAKPFTHARRYTLSRFPLLRKGSRELSRTPSASSRSPAGSPFHATGAPRASQPVARGPDISPARDSATPTPEDSNVIAEEAENTPQHLSRAARPEKMHQTSSRLLRMTDDERPYTRVSTRIQQFSHFGGRLGKSATMVTSHGPGKLRQYTTYATVRRNWLDPAPPRTATVTSFDNQPKAPGEIVFKLENKYFALGNNDFQPMFLRCRRIRKNREGGLWADGHEEVCSSTWIYRVDVTTADHDHPWICRILELRLLFTPWIFCV
jgi:hypothetical protein